MDAKNAWEQLGLLQNVTRLTGVIHEAQAIQLRIWPLVACRYAKSAEATWDPDTRVVTFKMKLKFFYIKPRDQEQRFELLDRSVKFLLGRDWSVVVKAKGKILFERGPDFGMRD